MGERPPGQIAGPAAWRAADLTPDEWLWSLSPAEIAEVESAARSLAASTSDLAAITAADFPLPKVAVGLARVLQEVLEGRGFAVIRGLDPDRLSLLEAAAAFLGIGAHLGALRPQNAQATSWATSRTSAVRLTIRRRGSTRPTNARPTTPTPATWSA